MQQWCLSTCNHLATIDLRRSLRNSNADMNAHPDLGHIPDVLKLQWIACPSTGMKGIIRDASCSKAIELDIKHRPLGTSESPLGWLSFPLEIHHMILAQLDPSTLRQLRAVNSYARSFVLEFPEYRDITNHAPGLIPSLHLTGLISYFSVLRMWSLLTSSKCVVCSQFGGYVFLPGLQRCCQRCAERDMEFSPITKDVAKKRYGVDSELAMTSLPKLISVPGRYSSGGGSTMTDIRGFKGKQVLISRTEARKFGSRNPSDDLEDGELYKRYMCLAPMPVLNLAKGRVERGIKCGGCKMSSENHVQGFADCSLPVLEEADEFVTRDPTQPHDAFDCPALLARHRFYSEKGFLTHCKKCKQAKRLLKSKVNGVTVRLSRDPRADLWVRQNPGVFWRTALEWQNSSDLEQPAPFPGSVAKLVVGLEIVRRPQDESARLESTSAICR